MMSSSVVDLAPSAVMVDAPLPTGATYSGSSVMCEVLQPSQSLQAGSSSGHPPNQGMTGVCTGGAPYGQGGQGQNNNALCFVMSTVCSMPSIHNDEEKL